MHTLYQEGTRRLARIAMAMMLLLLVLFLQKAAPVQAATLAGSTDTENVADTQTISSAQEAAYAAAVAASGSSTSVVSVSDESADEENSSLPAAPECEIINLFDDGDGSFTSYTITGDIAMTLMMTNADGSYYIDPVTNYYVCDYEKMQGFFSGLAFLFPADGSVYTSGFVTTDGTVLTDYDGSFQDLKSLDIEAEIEYLASAIMEQRTEAHFPSYTPGGTYIEIDITNQVLYYYQDGSLAVTCPVVTGSLASSHDTPTGVYSILGKATNQTLNGQGYSSFVYYWMNFIGNSYGIHDATWRSSFGGSIYQSNGSHGCVNIPLSTMEELYGMVEIGTPVILYQL